MTMGQGLPVHPFTGLEAIGYKKSGDPIWPIMGGDGEGEDPPKPGQAEPLVAGANPAWNEFLEPLPEEVRPEVVPVLQKWDQGVQEKLQQVQSEYEPWKDFVKSGVDPETAQFAVEVLAKMQEDPRAIYDSLGQHFQWSNGEEDTGTTPSGQGLDNGSGEGEQFEYDLESNPAFQEIKRSNKVMADIILAKHNQELEREQEAQLDQEFRQAEEKFGKFDQDAENYVLMYMAQNDVSVEEAAEAYYTFLERKGGRRPAPRLHGGSGGGAVPAPKLNPKKMSDKEARDAFVQMLTSGPEG